MKENSILDEPTYFTRKTVSEHLKISLRTVDSIREKGLLREMARIGNVVLFTPDSVRDLQEYFEKKEWYRGESDGLE